MTAKPWKHAPFVIAKKVHLSGYPTKIWNPVWEVYLDGTLKFSAPTYERAQEYCLDNQGQVGGR